MTLAEIEAQAVVNMLVDTLEKTKTEKLKAKTLDDTLGTAAAKPLVKTLADTKQ